MKLIIYLYNQPALSLSLFNVSLLFLFQLDGDVATAVHDLLKIGGHQSQLTHELRRFRQLLELYCFDEGALETAR